MHAALGHVKPPAATRQPESLAHLAEIEPKPLVHYRTDSPTKLSEMLLYSKMAMLITLAENSIIEVRIFSIDERTGLQKVINSVETLRQTLIYIT